MVQLIAFALSALFGLGFFLDLSSAVHATGMLGFTLGATHAISHYGVPAVFLTWFGRASEA